MANALHWSGGNANYDASKIIYDNRKLSEVLKEIESQTLPENLATKQYVDDAIAGIESGEFNINYATDEEIQLIIDGVDDIING